jgi:hypothetical protein
VAGAAKDSENADITHDEFHFFEFHVLTVSSLVELVHRWLLLVLATITQFKCGGVRYDHHVNKW